MLQLHHVLVTFGTFKKPETLNRKILFLVRTLQKRVYIRFSSNVLHPLIFRSL